MKITIKLLGQNENKEDSFFFDKDTKLSEIRRQIEAEKFIPPDPDNQEKPTKFYFLEGPRGVEIQKGMENTMKLQWVLDEADNPPVLYMSQSADIVGTLTDWIYQSGLSVQVKLNKDDDNAKRINEKKTEPIQLVDVSENSTNIVSIQNAIVCDADSAIAIEFSYAGPLGYAFYLYDGAEDIYSASCVSPKTKPDEERWAGVHTFGNETRDLILIKNAHGDDVKAADNKVIAKHMKMMIEVWGLKGWQLGDKDNNNQVWGGTMKDDAPWPYRQSFSQSDTITMESNLLLNSMGSSADSNEETRTIRGRDVDPGYIAHGPGTKWEDSTYIWQADPTFEQGHANPDAIIPLHFFVFKDHETALKYVKANAEEASW